MKNIIIVLCLLISSNQLWSKDSRTKMLEGLASWSDLKKSKVFKNETNKALSVRCFVKDDKTSGMYAQEPIIKPGKSYTFDLIKARRHLASLDRKHKKNKSYEVSVSVGVVTTVPQSLDKAVQYRPLNRQELGMKLTSQEFLKHDTFYIQKNKQGALFCKPF